MTELKLEPFGKMPDGRNIDLYTLTNEHGTRVAVTTYGARLVRFEKGVQGHLVDIVLGYTRGEDYVRDTAYMGAVIGRHANRIAGGRITVGGRPCLLELNSGSKKQNHIHGGAHGLHTHLFDADIGLANLDFILNVRVNKNLLLLLKGECSLKDILI